MAETFVLVVSDDLCRLGNLLAHSFKALEWATMEGHWKVAQHLVLFPELAAAASSFQVRVLVERLELCEAKRREARQCNFQWRHGVASAPPARGTARPPGTYSC